MKGKIAALAAAAAILLSAAAAFAAQPDGNGFDQFGYNYRAKNFVGTGSEWCQGKLGMSPNDCDAYMDPYHNDRLKMKWSQAWDDAIFGPNGVREDGDELPWTSGAWTDNQWNGMKDGSGEVWHFKIKWVGTCPNGELGPNGGDCIWGQFETLMDHGTFDGEHSWYGHAIPAGYGGH